MLKRAACEDYHRWLDGTLAARALISALARI
jgi:hypothetical protein